MLVYDGFMTTVEIIDQILTPLTACLTPEAAKQIVDFQPDAATRRAVEVLAAKANAGELTAEEGQKYQEYIDAFDLVATIKSKARSVLAATDA